MSGAALTLAAVAALVVDPACGAVRVDTSAGKQFARHVVATIRQESGFKPLAIRDETTGESLFPSTLADAVRIATERDAAGRVLGLGLGQITGRANWRRHGLTIAVALTPCPAVSAAVRHLAGDVRHVLGLSSRRYNTGSTERGEGYARSVAALADALPPDLFVPGNTDASRAAQPVPPPAPAEPSCAPSWDAWAFAECGVRSRLAPRHAPPPGTSLATANSGIADVGRNP